MTAKPLEGKVAVITGASRGLGLGIAQTYARAGASVVLAARSRRTLETAVDDLRAEGLHAAGLTCDVGDLAQVEALADYALDTFGRLDIWVNNAGVAGVYGPTAHMPVERFQVVIRTNIEGTYYGSVVALRHMLQQKSGRIINLLGRGDSGPVKYQNAYASSKTWVKSFTLALAQEYRDSGVGIHAFNPGLVDTEMLRQIDAMEGFEQKLNALRTVIRLWANPPDVPARKALWLASPATEGKTGLVINVLNPPMIVGGVLRDLSRRLRGVSGPDTALDITTVRSQL